MDINTITQLIGSVGFPITACLIMFYQNNKLQETLTELTKTLTSMNERIENIEDSLEKSGGNKNE